MTGKQKVCLSEKGEIEDGDRGRDREREREESLKEQFSRLAFSG